MLLIPGCFPHAHLPLQHQLCRRDLPRHFEGELVARVDNFKGSFVDLLAAHRLQSPYEPFI